MPDHVHMMLSIPPTYAVSQVVGFIKGKSAIHRRAPSVREVLDEDRAQHREVREWRDAEQLDDAARTSV